MKLAFVEAAMQRLVVAKRSKNKSERTIQLRKVSLIKIRILSSSGRSTTKMLKLKIRKSRARHLNIRLKIRPLMISPRQMAGVGASREIATKVLTSILASITKRKPKSQKPRLQ
jgi:hypothetical protein